MSNTPASKATLSFADGTPAVEMPVYKGTIGPDVVDIRKLYGALRTSSPSTPAS